VAPWAVTWEVIERLGAQEWLLSAAHLQRRLHWRPTSRERKNRVRPLLETIQGFRTPEQTRQGIEPILGVQRVRPRSFAHSTPWADRALNAGLPVGTPRAYSGLNPIKLRRFGVERHLRFVGLDHFLGASWGTITNDLGARATLQTSGRFHNASLIAAFSLRVMLRAACERRTRCPD